MFNKLQNFTLINILFMVLTSCIDITKIYFITFWQNSFDKKLDC
jgi:hypothetical protein